MSSYSFCQLWKVLVPCPPQCHEFPALLGSNQPNSPKCGNCSIGAIKCKPRIIKYIPSHFSRLGILQHHYVHDHLSGTLTFYKPICFYKKSPKKTFWCLPFVDLSHKFLRNQILLDLKKRNLEVSYTKFCLYLKSKFPQHEDQIWTR